MAARKATSGVQTLSFDRRLLGACCSLPGGYLFHGFFISASGLIFANHAALLSLTPSQRVVLMLLFVLTCSYLTGYIVYRAIELPGIRLGKLLLESLVPATVSSAARVRAPEETGVRDEIRTSVRLTP